MTTGETEAFATRLPAAEAARVRDAIDQTGLSRSDLLARALGYYMVENPDRIPAFRSGNPGIGPLEKAGILLPGTESDWTPVEKQ
jgi:hypothetical protein